MKLFEFISILLEYKRDITAQKLGDKLVGAGQRDGNKDIDTILNTLEQIDPTTNKQYVEWLCKQYINGEFRLEDYPRVNDVLVKFENAKRRMPIRDINKYSFRSLEDEMDKIYNVELDKDSLDTGTFPVITDTEILYNGPLGQLSIPETEEASCELGRGTKWCTAANKNNQFDHYNEIGPLYVWRDKNGERYQFHFPNDDDSWFDDIDDIEFQLMDIKDKPIDDKTLKYFRTEHPVLKKLFKEKEKEILSSPNKAVCYARDVIQGRWPEAEKVIASDPYSAYHYANEVIQGRWPEAEEIIKTNIGVAADYAAHVIKGRWPEAEKTIASNPNDAISYAMYAIKGRFPEAEEAIASDPHAAYSYAEHVIKDPYPQTWGKRYLAGKAK